MSDHDLHNHHEHGEHCACGHDHLSHHAHEHGDNCSCGHEHHAPHQHNNDGHDHESHEPAFGAVYTEYHLHDEARVISGRLTLSADYEKLRVLIAGQLESLAKSIQERDGIVGHIKASCTVKKVEMFSVTDTDVAVKSAPEQEISINLASIVFLIEPEEAEMLVKTALEAIKAGM